MEVMANHAALAAPAWNGNHQTVTWRCAGKIIVGKLAGVGIRDYQQIRKIRARTQRIDAVAGIGQPPCSVSADCRTGNHHGFEINPIERSTIPLPQVVKQIPNHMYIFAIDHLRAPLPKWRGVAFGRNHDEGIACLDPGLVQFLAGIRRFRAGRKENDQRMAPRLSRNAQRK